MWALEIVLKDTCSQVSFVQHPLLWFFLLYLCRGTRICPMFAKGPNFSQTTVVGGILQNTGWCPGESCVCVSTYMSVEGYSQYWKPLELVSIWRTISFENTCSKPHIRKEAGFQRCNCIFERVYQSGLQRFPQRLCMHRMNHCEVLCGLRFRLRI